MEHNFTALAHTPGPWSFDPVELIVSDHTGNTNAMIATVAQREEKTDDADETSANGWLIAAAPLLLDACEQQLANWRMLEAGAWDGNPDVIQVAIESLEDIIARAHGTLP